jgi:hypothetical protein
VVRKPDYNYGGSTRSRVGGEEYLTAEDVASVGASRLGGEVPCISTAPERRSPA